MGNLHCAPEDAAHLASVARDICPFPNYNPSPHFSKMLSINSSVNLRDHYTEVQSSLTPKQLEDFTQGLRTTFGREGKVTLGGVGIVALSLAVLFDTLARQARGECVSDSGPIPGLFIKNPKGYYPPTVYTASEYLRFVPHIANNPTRMLEESERYLNQSIIDKQSLVENRPDDVTTINIMLGFFFTASLNIHIARIKNTTAHEIPSFDEKVPDDIFNLNCDPEVADKDFLAEVQKSDNHTQEAFERCKPRSGRVTSWLKHVANLEWLDVVFLPLIVSGNDAALLIDQREDFDLKAGALGKWVE